MLVKTSLKRPTSATSNIKCMLAHFWKFLRSSIPLIYITPLETVLKTGRETTHLLGSEQKSYFAMFPEWIRSSFFPARSPLNSITVYSSSSYLHRQRNVQSADHLSGFHNTLQGPRKQCFLPHYSPENLITIQILYARKARSGGRQNPLKIRKEATCCSGKGRPPLSKGFQPRNRAWNLTWYEQFSWCTISVHPRAQTPKQDGSARLRRQDAEHPRAARTPWEGRGSPRIKMDAVSLSNLRSGTACAGKRAASRAALLGNQQWGSQTWS